MSQAIIISDYIDDWRLVLLERLSSLFLIKLGISSSLVVWLLSFTLSLDCE